MNYEVERIWKETGVAYWRYLFEGTEVNLSQDSLCSSRDSKPTLSEYNSGALQFEEPIRWKKNIIMKIYRPIHIHRMMQSISGVPLHKCHGTVIFNYNDNLEAVVICIFIKQTIKVNEKHRSTRIQKLLPWFHVMSSHIWLGFDPTKWSTTNLNCV
jgi:hypothetical protein